MSPRSPIRRRQNMCPPVLQGRDFSIGADLRTIPGAGRQANFRGIGTIAMAGTLRLDFRAIWRRSRHREGPLMDVMQGKRQLNALFDQLDRDGRTLKYNPTIDAIESGRLSKDQLRHWATQLYIGNKGHNANILGLIYAKCDNFAARKAIVENLLEEELGRQSGVMRSHMELYLEF